MSERDHTFDGSPKPIEKLIQLKACITSAEEGTSTINVASDMLFSEKSPQFFQKLVAKYQLLPIFVSDRDTSLAAYIFHITNMYVSSYLISIEENATEIPNEYLEALFDELEIEDT